MSDSMFRRWISEKLTGKADCHSIKAPFVCAGCHYIWDSIPRYQAHIQYCLLDRYAVRTYAKQTRADYVDEHTANKPSIQALSRCTVRLKNGLRQGHHCLRKKSSRDSTYCDFHSSLARQSTEHGDHPHAHQTQEAQPGQLASRTQ